MGRGYVFPGFARGGAETVETGFASEASVSYAL
jgi:hypothetical protein